MTFIQHIVKSPLTAFQQHFQAPDRQNPCFWKNEAPKARYDLPENRPIAKIRPNQRLPESGRFAGRFGSNPATYRDRIGFSPSVFCRTPVPFSDSRPLQLCRNLFFPVTLWSENRQSAAEMNVSQNYPV